VCAIRAIGYSQPIPVGPDHVHMRRLWPLTRGGGVDRRKDVHGDDDEGVPYHN